jgi:hypothetical protein
MKDIKTVPVDEHPLAMVGHCCGGRFPLLQTLEDGIDFTPTAAVRARMAALQEAARSELPPPACTGAGGKP